MEETPELDRFYRENKESVNFLVVAVDDTEEAVREVLAQANASLPVLLDSGEIATSYRVSGVPTAWSISPEGSLVRIHVGFSGAEQLAALAEEAS